MTQYSQDILKAAHDCSFANENDLKAPQQCGCFYCLKTFPSSEIAEYSDDEPIKTALCPYCGIDAVIGENAGYPLTQDFLEAMCQEWFESVSSDE